MVGFLDPQMPTDDLALTHPTPVPCFHLRESFGWPRAGGRCAHEMLTCLSPELLPPKESLQVGKEEAQAGGEAGRAHMPLHLGPGGRLFPDNNDIR